MIERKPPFGATRANPRVALVTCSDLPDLEPDDRLVIEPLAARGVRAEPAVWDDPRIDWTGYELVVLRSPWDYVARRTAFVEWAHRVPRLANPATVVAWNTEKTYLELLAADGVPVVPTEWVRPGDSWNPPASGEYVVKPAISAGSKDTGRYDLADPTHRALAAAHVARLQGADRLVMVQPYLTAADTDGETALLFLGGEFSHAIRKGPMLDGPDVPQEGLYRREDITARQPSPVQLEVAEKVLAAIPGGAGALLYARVDLMAGPDGYPMLVELELTEPSLFLAHSAGAAERFADAIAARVLA